MALRRLSGENPWTTIRAAMRLAATRQPSVVLGHLRFMEPIGRSEANATTDSVVIRGAFEPALSLKELAAELNVSIQTLYDLRSQGRGPVGFRVGRCLRFRRSEIQAWLERLEHEDIVRHPGGDAS